MFNWLKEIFKDNRIPSVSFYEFTKKITELSRSNLYPYEYNLPQAITFTGKFWKKIISIHKQTLEDGLEREVSLFNADGDLVITEVVLGDESSVKAGHSINVKYSKHPTKSQYLRKEIFLDGKLYERSDVFYKNIPKKIVVEYLFNLHTHPKQILAGGSEIYSFVSKQDISSLLKSKAVVTGLITDKLYLFVRTSNTPLDINMEEYEFSKESLKERMHIFTYEAEFWKKGIRG